MYAIIILALARAIMSFLTAFLNCTPMSYNWDTSISGSCDNATATLISAGVLDVIIDLSIFVSPMPCTWQLQLPTRVKIALTSLFALTVCDICTGILRVWSLINYDNSSDWTYVGALPWLFSILQPGAGIIIACLILMRPLLDKLAPKRWLFKVANIGSWSSRKRRYREMSDEKAIESKTKPLTLRLASSLAELGSNYPGNEKTMGGAGTTEACSSCEDDRHSSV